MSAETAIEIWKVTRLSNEQTAANISRYFSDGYFVANAQRKPLDGRAWDEFVCIEFETVAVKQIQFQLRSLFAITHVNRQIKYVLVSVSAPQPTTKPLFFDFQRQANMTFDFNECAYFSIQYFFSLSEFIGDREMWLCIIVDEQNELIACLLLFKFFL